MESKDLNNLEIYQIALNLSSRAWVIFQSMDKSLQFSIGDQFLRSTDSIGANISEGFGRFHYKDSLKFYYNSRGSLYETKHWLELLIKRSLIKEIEYDEFSSEINILAIKLNNFINYLKNKSSTT